MAGQGTKLDTLQRHETYFLPGGDLYFLVDNILFRVHKFFFERESKFFQEQFSVPAAPGEQVRGASESSALIFDDVTSTDFERLLWVFYNPTYSLYDTSVDVWTSILQLANRWDFPEVKALAVRELEKISMLDTDRIVLYHRYAVDKKILIPRYAALCAREYPLTNEEGHKLGIETALLISRARECARCNRTNSSAISPLPLDFKEDDMRSLITDLFVHQENAVPLPNDLPNGHSAPPQTPPTSAPQQPSGNSGDNARPKGGKNKHNEASSPHINTGSKNKKNQKNWPVDPLVPPTPTTANGTSTGDAD